MTTWDLTFSQPNVPLSMNKTKGAHWGAVKRRLDPWNRLAWAVARNRRITSGAAFTPVPITVQVTLTFRGRRRRDGHNYTSTVAKAIVDGLVAAGVVPDDTPDWVTVLDPELVCILPPRPLTATVAIRPRPTQENPT